MDSQRGKTSVQPAMDVELAECPALSLSRRAAVIALTAVVAGCGEGGVGGMTSILTGSEPQGPQLATAEADTWLGATGTRFSTGAVEMQLANVEALPTVGTRPADLRKGAFIATFDVVSGGYLPGNKVHRVSSAKVPTFDIFLTNSFDVPTRLYALFN